jgi:hypothetical protein
MLNFKNRASNFIVGTAALGAIGAALIMPAAASASWDEPWPEPPSCSNDTGTCSTMEDIVAYECYFENPDSPFHFCDDPLNQEMKKDTNSFVAPKQDSGRTQQIAVLALKR